MTINMMNLQYNNYIGWEKNMDNPDKFLKDTDSKMKLKTPL